MAASKHAAWYHACRAAVSSALLFCCAVGAAGFLAFLVVLLFLKIVLILCAGIACDCRNRFVDALRHQ
ncbi:MAG: hypothetical protein CL477_02685 [Acidobacteria bacterium]|nr:hypothetical protein [Acidobacteriota bacterium]HCV27007.1 hypothetical protein [Dehalococcoidia bacterium]